MSIFSNSANSQVFSRKLLFLLNILILICMNANLNANVLPKRVGPPQLINPNPVTNPDPILQNQNLQTVMNDLFQTPYYPGGSPDYLSQIYYFSNFYIASASRFDFNPTNDKIMNIAFAQNVITDLTGTFAQPIIASNTFATSFNRGLTWNYGPPIEQIIPLGGTISQVINASLGPGLNFYYSKCGRLYASGNGFFDTIANPPNNVPLTGFLFTSSENNGKNWATPNIVLKSKIDWLFFGGPFGTGFGEWEFFAKPHPEDSNRINAESTFRLFPDSLFGDLLYLSSNDGGKKFSPLRVAYNLTMDPVWRAKHFDPNYNDPNYSIYGGFTAVAGFPTVVDQNVLLLPTRRNYPKVGSTTYTGVPSDTNWDQAVARSLDNGKTWLKVAGATEQFLPEVGPFDPGFINPNIPVIINGNLAFGFLEDGTFHISRPLVSSYTGRVYLHYEAGNPAANPDPEIAWLYPYVLLNASSDQGATWSRSVQINRTPTNISPGAQQAFAHNVVLTEDGYLILAYYDFRNWTGKPGEDLLSTPLPTDCWLDVYRETSDPEGGSTGVGLDFVGEIRLTPESFDGRIPNVETALPYVSPFITGTPQGVPMFVNKKNELFVVFSMTHSGSPSNIITNGYRGMTIDTNGYIDIYLQRFKFPNITNR